jgi:hypothetical protein
MEFKMSMVIGVLLWLATPMALAADPLMSDTERLHRQRQQAAKDFKEEVDKVLKSLCINSHVLAAASDKIGYDFGLDLPVWRKIAKTIVRVKIGRAHNALACKNIVCKSQDVPTHYEVTEKIVDEAYVRYLFKMNHCAGDSIVACFKALNYAFNSYNSFSNRLDRLFNVCRKKDR